MNVILASGSPRRRQLLRDAGVAFSVEPSDADESLDDDLRANPAKAARAVAERKAASVVQRLIGGEPVPGRTCVIGADTMVVLDGAIFGKPHTYSEGVGMLRKLSGRTHEVITGVSVWMVDVDDEGKVSLGRQGFSETSEVTFKRLSDDDIAAYLRKGESYDKAGAYAIQGAGADLVEHYEGDYANIVGLPVDTLLALFPDLKGQASE